MESSCYFIYDEQYVHIEGIEKYRALLKDTVTGMFVEDILDDLSEETISGFLITAQSGDHHTLQYGSYCHNNRRLSL